MEFHFTVAMFVSIHLFSLLAIHYAAPNIGEVLKYRLNKTDKSPSHKAHVLVFEVSE